MTVFIEEGDPLSEHISYSQVSTYLLCGYQYYLSKIKHEPEEESVWSVGGSAFHKACELWDYEQVANG